MHGFHAATRRWFSESFGEPTGVQSQGWERLASGGHVLLVAPTGSGKTLAAFLHAIDRLMHSPEPDQPGFRVLYVSPLKALVYDIERNLRAPLAGIARTAGRLQEHSLSDEVLRIPQVSIRTGDTSPRDRQRMIRKPGEILVTTPESLYLMLGSKARSVLSTVELVIIDEVHALAPTKRGAHLALSLERLAALTEQEPQRVALSATAHPLKEVARFVGGPRAVDIVDTSRAPSLDLRIEVPVDDMTKPAPESDDPQNDDEGDAADDDGILFDLPLEVATEPARPKQASIWPAVHQRLLELITTHRTTIVFVNSRGLAERLAQQLNELAQGPPSDEQAEVAPLVRAHHGSLAQPQRRDIEEAMKEGKLQGIVATSSLELGIDMGTVDLVVLVESPGAVSRGLQRVGRAGHGVGEISVGRVLPKHRGDLLEATVVSQRMREGKLEAIRLVENPIDVLAQHAVAIATFEPISVEALDALVRRAANFQNLPKGAFFGVLDMLSGKYPSHDFADLRPRLLWDREKDELSGRKGSRLLAAVNGGTIPDRGLYAVHLGSEGPKVGELDEEMVHETVSGQVILLGASSWRVEAITKDRVEVSPAPGEPGKLPFWHGEGPGRPLDLGQAVGAFLREVGAMPAPAARRLMQDHYQLDGRAAQNLLRYIEEQQEHTGLLPTDQTVVIERFRDELGDWRVCILTPFGARVHAPWALAIQAGLTEEAGFSVQIIWSDDGIVLTLADGDSPAELFGEALDALLIPPADLEERLMGQLASSALFASQFRENAARSLLLPRRSPKARTPLWAQRMRSQKLLAVAQGFPSFPIIMETYRSTLRDVFDLPGLQSILKAIANGDIRSHVVETQNASPFARSLVFAYVAAYLYEGDSPLAERRAQALTLDRQLLRELLGEDEMRELYDAEVMQRVEDELQFLTESRMARHVDGLHHMLCVLGDLSEEHITLRCTEPLLPMLEDLHNNRRAFPVKVAGRPVWIAVEDVALFRDALGTPVPPGVPQAFLETVPDSLEVLLRRHARTHGPFSTRQFAKRYGLPEKQVGQALAGLAEQGLTEAGTFLATPDGSEEWCDKEVLRRINRETRAKVRGEVSPVDRSVLGRFLPAWHGVRPIEEDTAGPSTRRSAELKGVLQQLEGLPLSLKDLESVILPSRIPNYRPAMLDELGALGWLVWVGSGSLGQQDGRIALYRREQAPLLLPRAYEGEHELPSAAHEAVVAFLAQRGTCFFPELSRGVSEISTAQLLDALWDLIWLGVMTNDTLQAVRTLGKRKTLLRRRNTRLDVLLGGRWSLTRSLGPEASGVTVTERAYSKVLTLMERYGVVGRAVASKETLEGGFLAHYRVLKEMETLGKIRRGYFVESLGGAQFASPGVVDRLRSLRHKADTPEVVLLASTDPANPYGALLPWPSRQDQSTTGAGPKRSAGTHVVLVNGHPVFYFGRKGARLHTFPDIDDDVVLLAAKALHQLARTQRGKVLRIDEIDGLSARTSPFGNLFREAGFNADHRGLVLEAR